MNLDLYCERLGPGLGAEPLNALSNLAFLIAAATIGAQGRRGPGPTDRGVTLLAATAAAIALGSGLFHTFATDWALLADVLPILAFQLLFLALYLRRRVALGRAATASLVGLFLLAGLGARSFAGILNGSLAYGPALLVLLILGLHHLRAGAQDPWLLLGSFAVFALSLTARTLDPLLCPWLPSGTHFLWHLLNAVVLVLAARSLPPSAGAARPSGSW